MTGSTGLSVLHLLSPAPVGGLERVVQGLARGQASRGHRVVAAAFAARADAADEFLTPLRDTRVDARFLEVPDRGYLDERRLVRSLCVELEPDIVHTHGYRPDVVDSGVARRRRIPTVSTVHGFIGGSLRGRVYERLQRRAFRHFDAVVAVSRPQVEILEKAGVRPQRIHVVPNAIDRGPVLPREEARALWGVDEGTFHIGWVGRLSHEKGLDVFLEALALLDRKGFVASVVGAGPALDDSRDRAQALGIADHIRWRGLVRDAAPMFPGFDVLVISSRTEGSPMVLLEAMSMRVPVVATRVGGVPHMVGPSEAVLVPPDDPEALARGIASVRSDPTAAGSRARAALDRFDSEFGFDQWIRRYDEVYREAMKSRGSP